MAWLCLSAVRLSKSAGHKLGRAELWCSIVLFIPFWNKKIYTLRAFGMWPLLSWGASVYGFSISKKQSGGGGDCRAQVSLLPYLPFHLSSHISQRSLCIASPSSITLLPTLLLTVWLPKGYLHVLIWKTLKPKWECISDLVINQNLNNGWISRNHVDVSPL